MSVVLEGFGPRN